MCVLIPLMVTGSVFTALLILFAVAYANSYEVKEQKTPRFVSAVIIYGVTSAVVGSGISRVTEALGMEYALWMSLAQMLINVIATVVLFKITVKLLKRSYLVQ